MELIRNKKSERELIDKKKNEIIKRTRSLTVNRTKETEKREKSEEININPKSEKLPKENIPNVKKFIKVKPILTNKKVKVYKKNPASHKIKAENKSNNFLTEENFRKKKNETNISLSPLNIDTENISLIPPINKVNKFVINNRLNRKKNELENENDNMINNTESNQNLFYKTSNQIKTMKKYEKPKLSINNNNDLFNSTNYNNKSLSKSKIIFDNESNPHSKYHESIIYSPKKLILQKMNSENNFKKSNKLDHNNNNNSNTNKNDNNFYIKKKSLLNETKNLSKSNCNILCDNFANIHNYYNNSKIFLKNKFISIHPSFSINNNFNNNKINNLEINTNSKNEYLYRNNKSKDVETNKKKILRKLGSGFLNFPNQGRYIYQKNKINRNIMNKNLQEKELNEIDNADTGKIDDINYEYLRLGTEEMTYNHNNHFKNAFLNLVDSYDKVYPENNTSSGIDNYNHIYVNNNYNENRLLNRTSPFYQKQIKKINISNTLNNMNYKRNYRLNTNNSILINIENILIFEEKFDILVSYLKNNKTITKPCLDFWNYYYNSYIYEKIEKIFNEEGDIEIIKMSANYLLLSVIICYYFSLKLEIYNNSIYLLLQLLEINFYSIMLIFQKINSNIIPENQNNEFLRILTSIYINYVKNSKYLDNSNLTVIEKIYNNTEKIDEKIKNLLSRKKIDFFKILYNFYFNIRQKDYKEINDFFINYILKEENINGSLFSSNFIINNNLAFSSIHPPFLKSPNKKKLTLILDLNETLINFKYEENGEGYVRIRPFLFGFLEEISQLYELIIFTSSEKEYADSVIEAIEHERTYFDHVFYRQHTIIVGNDFVKDLTRIGRPLNSMIIIDNMPQNFKLQKENGILIKPFWGEETNDRTLYDLIPILLDIAKEGGDVRYALNKYRNEIIGKISSNISKRNSN